jgi:hypothetical protein
MSRESIYKGVLAFKLENTKYVIRYIKSNDELLERMQRQGKDTIQDEAFKWAKENNEEFGNRLSLELYDVFWEKVYYGIRAK